MSSFHVMSDVLKGLVFMYTSADWFRYYTRSLCLKIVCIRLEWNIILEEEATDIKKNNM